MDYIPYFGNLENVVGFVGYWGLFAAVFAETGIFFMFFLPGSSMLFTAGLLASHGLFNVWILLPLITLAAILGDSTGYWFGKVVGHALYKREDSRWFKKAYIERTHEFYEKHGVSAVVLARFVPIIRTFAPILAGVAAMSYKKFLTYNVIGGVLWGAGITFAGYYLGENVPFVEKYLTPIILLIIITSFIPIISQWFKTARKTKDAEEKSNTRCPRAVIFDLDNTLAESFNPPKPEVASRLGKLLELMPVGVMTGASFSRMQEHLLPSLPKGADKSKLYLFPDTAAQCFMWKDGQWQSIYKFVFTKDEYEKIMSTFRDAIKETGALQGAPRWGDLFLARDVQVTFAGLGVDAPPEAKAKWDPDRQKRQKLKDYLAKRLQWLDIRISGRTAIDITGKEIDKAHGVKWLANRLGVKPHQMLFIGDDLSPGGNDAVVIPTGIQTVQVAGPHETADAIDKVFAVCAK